MKFAPVYVGDVALGVEKIIDDEIKIETIEFVGNEIFNLTEILKIISNEIRRKNIIIPVPSWFGKIQGVVFGLAPNPILTLDQVRTLESGDNIASGKNRTLFDLKINLQGIRKIIPKKI